jgi:hypothetical protein
MSYRTLGLVTSAAAVSAAVLPAFPAQAAPGVSSGAAVAATSPRQIRQMSITELRQLQPRVRLAVARSRVDRAVGYQGQRRCMRGNRPGTIALRNLLKAVYDSGVPIGMSRGCGRGSEHHDGRALDWMMNSRNPRQAAQADAFVRFLTAQRQGVQGANARRLGVMYIIWRGRMWRSYAPGWRNYNGCANGGPASACHFNHVHISLNWKGAYKRTSWYRHFG